MLTLRLIFLIVYYGSLKIMAKQQPITMVALGRPLHLGTLYNIRSDKIITGATLWDPQILANNTISRKQPYTGFEVIAEDSLQNKAHALGIDASLKLSLLGGLISVSGSAKYAEDYQRTNHETRLTLKYSTTTHMETLTMKHLGKGNLNHPDLHDIDLATHVVTGVLYGAEAFFIFDRTVSNGESKKEISGSLRAVFDNPIFKIDGEAKFDLTDREKKFVDKLHCKFYGDFHLSENPNTFAEAVRIYRQLPSLLGKNNENAIPKKVWLYPLHLLDNKAMRIVRDISSNLIDYSILVIEKLHSLEVTALDLSESPIFTYLNHMKKHLLDFSIRLSEFQRDLKEKIALYLPQLRGSTGIEESVLFNLFKQVDSSPFNQQKIESWLEEKRKEIALMTSWIENIAKDRRLNITIKSSSLIEAIGDIEYDYIFCLSFRFVEKNDSQLSDMYNYRYNKNNFNSSNSGQKRTKWFEDRRIIAKIRKYVQQFIEFAKVNNVENGKIKFIVDEEYSVGHVKGAEFILYDDGSEKKNFIIPSKPDAPYAKNITDNSVTLEWTDADNGTEKVIKYKVMYHKYTGKNEDEIKENWTEVYINTNHKKIVISNLPSKTTFVFKVQSITAIGLSVISCLSKPIETLTKKVDTKWKQYATTTAGSHGTGNQLNQLSYPRAVFIDDDQTIYVADYQNHRIVEWKRNAINGKIVAGGNGQGNRNDQLNGPRKAIIDKENDSLIICDSSNRRVVRWSRRNSQSGEILISNISCRDLIIDNNGYLYVSDDKKHEVRRWKMGETEGSIVAGGNEEGNRLDQLYNPYYIFIDEDHSVYVSDSENNRVMKWLKGAKEGIVVAGGQDTGNGLRQLSSPRGIIIDQLGSVYVADARNHRVMRWLKGAQEGTIVVGGNGKGNQFNQFSFPIDLSFDLENNLYVVDCDNHRVQRFDVNSNESG